MLTEGLAGLDRGLAAATVDWRTVTNERRVLVHPDVEALIAAVAARFLTKLTDLLDEYHHVNVVLTGGTAGGQGVQHAIATSPMRGAIDWSRVHFWWGDERFLPQGDPERNETQAHEALLDHIPVPPENIHPFPASDVVPDIDEAAGVYAAELARARRPGAAADRAALRHHVPRRRPRRAHRFAVPGARRARSTTTGW